MYQSYSAEDYELSQLTHSTWLKRPTIIWKDVPSSQSVERGTFYANLAIVKGFDSIIVVVGDVPARPWLVLRGQYKIKVIAVSIKNPIREASDAIHRIGSSKCCQTSSYSQHTKTA
jgi:hypothetical protein